MAMSKRRQIGFLKEAGVDPNKYENKQEFDKLVHEGVDYKDKKKRYWVDRNGRDCFAIYARGLDIDNSNISNQWQWTTDSNGVEMAELVEATWLGVKGAFWTMNLSHGVEYKVSFLIKMAKPSSTMVGKMVNLKLTLPDGTDIANPAPLPGFPLPDKQLWHELEVGKFKMSEQYVGEIKFSMEQGFDKGETGLVIKCVEIKTA